jgi:CSLREA domain-containing protein
MHSASRIVLLLLVATATLSIFTFVFPHSVVRAATIMVNSSADTADLSPDNGICDVGGGICTLRAAIQTAQGTGNPGADTITFGFAIYPQTIILGSALPDISTPITLQGPTNSSASLAISGNNAVRVLNVIANGNLTIDTLTVTNGRAEGGGGIRKLKAY